MLWMSRNVASKGHENNKRQQLHSTLESNELGGGWARRRTVHQVWRHFEKPGPIWDGSHTGFRGPQHPIRDSHWQKKRDGSGICITVKGWVLAPWTIWETIAIKNSYTTIHLLILLLKKQKYRKFVEVEDIDEYVCDNCKAAVPALLRTTIFRLPGE